MLKTTTYFWNAAAESAPPSPKIKAALDLDRTDAAYTIWLSPDEMKTLWAEIGPEANGDLIANLQDSRPLCLNDQGEKYTPRIDYAFTRDQIAKVWLEIGMSYSWAQAGTEIEGWIDVAYRTLAEHGAQTISIKRELPPRYVTITAGWA